MTTTSTTPQDPASEKAHAERLDALRKSLAACIDEIVDARADRAAILKKEFDAAWKELNAEVDATLH